MKTGLGLGTASYKPIHRVSNTSSVNSGSAFANDATVGTRTWGAPSNAQTSNNIYATVITTGTTQYLLATGFNFSIPFNAEIKGIKVEVEKKKNVTGTANDNSVKLYRGSFVGNDATAVEWQTSDTYASYGGATDLWGTTWTPAQINASNFGVGFSATFTGLGSLSVDHIRITVYYDTFE